MTDLHEAYPASWLVSLQAPTVKLRNRYQTTTLRNYISPLHYLTMLFTPNNFGECLQEWEDLEKDYQQIQVR